MIKEIGNGFTGAIIAFRPQVIAPGIGRMRSYYFARKWQALVGNTIWSNGASPAAKDWQGRKLEGAEILVIAGEYMPAYDRSAYVYFVAPGADYSILPAWVQKEVRGCLA